MTENENHSCAEKGATNFKEFFAILLKSKVNGLVPLAGSVMLLLFLFIHNGILAVSWIKFGTLIFVFAFMFMIAERFFNFKPKYIQLINMILIIAFSVLMIIGFLKIWTAGGWAKASFDTVLYTILLLIFTLSVNLYWCWDLIIPKMIAKKAAKQADPNKVEVELIDSEEKVPEATPVIEPAPEVTTDEDEV